MGFILGILAFILCIYSLTYKKINKFIIKIKYSKLIKFHYIIGIIAFIAATIHSAINFNGELLTIGTVSWFLFLCVIILGILLTKLKGKKRELVLILHWGISILMVGVVIFHILYNIIL